MDPLSNVLSLLKPRSYLAGGLEFGGRWAVRFSAYEGVKCYAVASGACWLAVDGVPDPVRLTTGDGFLLPRGRPFRLASDLDVEPTDARALFRTAGTGSFLAVNGGGDVALFGGYFGLTGPHAGMLLELLPPVVHLRTDADRAVLRWSLERMREELRESQPGNVLVVQHLASLMLVQALRLYLADGVRGGVGWLFALADGQMRAAISAMHEDPARGWTVQALAAHAGMSRTSFAVRFRATVGAPPLDYLTRWRMLLAGDRLATSGESIAVIARSLGYGSESAFSTAFKRVMGCPPREYGRGGPGRTAPRDRTRGRRSAAARS